MVLPQRDNSIEEIKRTDALLEYAVMNGDKASMGSDTAVATACGSDASHRRIAIEVDNFHRVFECSNGK